MKRYVGTKDDWPFVEGWLEGLDGAGAEENRYYARDLFAWDYGRYMAQEYLDALKAERGQ